MLTVLLFVIAMAAVVVFFVAGHHLLSDRSDRTVQGAAHAANQALLRADLATESYAEHESYDAGNTGFTRY
jgi:hypothetical protein